MMLPFAQWIDRCRLSCWRDAERHGLTIEETARQLREAAWLEMVAETAPATPLPPAGGAGGGPVSEPANPHAVAQPNWHRLGFAGPEDAEGRN